MERLDLAPVRRAAGTLRLPGSKSISNRTLLLAALARGETQLRGVLDSDDTRVMREALRKLGVAVEAQRPGEEHLRVRGVGAGSFPVKSADLFVGNSGTTIRSLTAALAVADGHYEVSGVPRMHERPIGDLVDALRQGGAAIEYRGKEGFPPLAIGPARAGSRNVRVRGDISSQYLTGLLMAYGATGLAARIELEGELISRPYVEMTLKLMERFGVSVRREEWHAFHIPASGGYRSPGAIDVEGDASSASYFLAAGVLGGGPVRVEGVGATSVQGDVAFAGMLEKVGARIAMGDTWMEARGATPVRAFDLDFNAIPDAAMTAAVLALFADGPSRLRNIASWRVKETDRIAAMATELRKFGAEVDEGADFLAIKPPASFLAPHASRPPPISVDTYEDHRMAMCFSLASFGPCPVRINDPACVSKTFPSYFTEFARLVS